MDTPLSSAPSELGPTLTTTPAPTLAHTQARAEKKTRLNLSKSMQSLKKKKGDKIHGRERSSSMSDEVPPVPAMPLPVPTHQPQKPAVAARTQQTPAVSQQKSGGFAAFLRKLTGRSSSPSPASSDRAKLEKRKTMVVPPSAKPKLGKLDTAGARGTAGPASAPVLSLSAPVGGTPAPGLASAVELSTPEPLPAVAPGFVPAPAAEKAEGVHGAEVDPCNIPLPPSPSLSPERNLPSQQSVNSAPSSPVVAMLPPGAAAPCVFGSGSPTQATQQRSVSGRSVGQPMLSLEGLEFDEEEEPATAVPAVAAGPRSPVQATPASPGSPISHTTFTASTPIASSTPTLPGTPTSPASKQSETERSDVVRPLPAPIRIPSINHPRSGGAPASASTLASTTTTSTSTGERIVTPTEPVAGGKMDLRGQPLVQMRSLSPPGGSLPDAGSARGRGKGLTAGTGGEFGEMGKKEKGWRKSMINLSGTLNGSASRRQSQKPPPATRAPPQVQPPTSHDAYAAQQQRLARNPGRVSCAPVVYRTGAEAVGRGRMVISKEDEDMAETFFMS
ncbi:hypothetical protein IAT38_002538 [Cryptococcus sp. DSM 104549]